MSHSHLEIIGPMTIKPRWGFLALVSLALTTGCAENAATTPTAPTAAPSASAPAATDQPAATGAPGAIPAPAPASPLTKDG